jgi:hypothetical protein
MESRRSPSSFAVLLAFALLPIVSMVAGGSEARVHALEWMPWQAKAQSLAHGVRSGLGELAGHDAGATPFVPAETFRLAHSAPRAARITSAQSVPSATAPATLHQARAPPAQS